MASTGIHHLRMANTKDINIIQYAENKTQSEMEYINSTNYDYSVKQNRRDQGCGVSVLFVGTPTLGLIV